jgi:hypothetical protein
MEDDHCRWESIRFVAGGTVRAGQRPWYHHSLAYRLSKIRSRAGYLGSPLVNIRSEVCEEPGRWQLRDHHLSSRWVREDDVCCYLSGRQEGQICQQLGKLICLVKVRATRKDRVRHNEGKRLESSARKDGNEMVSKGRKGQEKELVDRKRALAGKVEGLYSRKEQETFKKEGK